jgi:hypothetical protein
MVFGVELTCFTISFCVSRGKSMKPILTSDDPDPDQLVALLERLLT